MTDPGSFEDATLGGVSLWRQIADALRLEIVGGRLAQGERLPGEVALAARFGVNRHTVRRALAALQEEGVVLAERGRGTFVSEVRRLSYRIGRRTRFSEGLAGQGKETRSVVIETSLEPASATVSRGLDLRPGTRVTRLETLSSLDGRPLSRATSWFPSQRFPYFGAVLAETGSVTLALQRFGIEDYIRVSTRISARRASVEEAKSLRLAPGAILLVSEGIDADPDGTPIQFAQSRFPADRLELVI